MNRIVAALSIILTLLAAPAAPPAWAAQPSAQAPAANASAPAAASDPGQVPPKASNVKEWLASHKRSVKDAAIGVVAGALAGLFAASALHKSKAQGAAIGAVVGGLAGFALGHHRDKLYAGRDQAVQLVGYDPSQLYVMRVEQISVEPANPKPGDSAVLEVQYVVIGPDPHEAIDVNSFRGIKYQDDYIAGDGPQKFTVPNGGGIVTSRLEVTIPRDAPAGTYTVEAMFENPQGRFKQTRSSPLYIMS